MSDEPRPPRLHPGTIADAASVVLEHVPVDPDQVVAGAPTVWTVRRTLRELYVAP